MDPDYVDPPLGRGVTTADMAAKAKALAASDRLDAPRSLAEWFPARPYPSSATYLREMEAYHERVDQIVEDDLSGYDAIVIVGGSGAMVDLANNQRLHDLIMGLVQLDKPVAAECYGVACLAFARDFREKRSIIRGRHVTGHPIDYDYPDGTGFEGPHALDGSQPASATAGSTSGRRSTRWSTSSATRWGPTGIHRQRRPQDVGPRRLPVHHEPVDRQLAGVRTLAGPGPRQGPAPPRLVTELVIGRPIAASTRRPL